MQSTLLNNSNATCMLVEAIAKNSQNVVWNISSHFSPYSFDAITLDLLQANKSFHHEKLIIAKPD
ncbi:MAG: Eco47II restriction endonuclease [Cyanobacteriota bacterium]|jgi:hypothetical protein